MKTSSTLRAFLTVCCAAFLSSCANDIEHRRSDDDHHTLRAQIDPTQRADNFQGNNLVVFYIFDTQKRLISTSSGVVDQDVDIRVSAVEQVTVVAFSYPQGASAASFASGTSIDQALWTLSTAEFGGMVTAQSPPTLWMGTMTLRVTPCDDNEEAPTHVVWLTRRVASLSIIARNMQSTLSTTDIDFTYFVRSTHSSLGFDGSYFGPMVGYTPPSHFVDDDGDFLAPKFNTLPIADADAFFIDIYKAGVLVETFGLDNDQNLLLLQAGKHTLVWLDFKGASSGANISVICKVLDWDSVLQLEEF